MMFVYRDEYYNDESENPGVAEVIIGKHRNGPVGNVELTFLDRYPKFVSIARDRAAAAAAAPRLTCCARRRTAGADRAGGVPRSASATAAAGSCARTTSPSRASAASG